MLLDKNTCHKARLSRDARFDGRFFTAVKTTGIYCRPVCPASPPREAHVEYFATAIEAARAGYRPCLRCRPDSAPGSPAWCGTDTTFARALTLIHQGALADATLTELAERLGIGDRYLRQLFQRALGVSPKTYALYCQCLLAKQLLHQTALPVTEVALASGFRSIRRFNECFQQHLGLTPTAVRRTCKHKQDSLTLKLAFRPPYDWPRVREFLRQRAVTGMEWVDERAYGRYFIEGKAKGYFTASFNAANHCFDVAIEMDDLSELQSVVTTIRRVLDLDADSDFIESQFHQTFGDALMWHSGLRLPGTWTVFEAGIRAVLGQQVSVAAAHRLTEQLVHTLGKDTHFFPTPQSLAESDLRFLKIPDTRRKTLHGLAQHFITDSEAENPESWLPLPGVGRWTVDYARMRGSGNPDVFLAGDLRIKRVLANQELNPDNAAPWRSYFTLQLWSQP